jgi:hypothetical protein
MILGMLVLNSIIAYVKEIPAITNNVRFLILNMFLLIILLLKDNRFQKKGIFSSSILFPDFGASDRIASAGVILSAPLAPISPERIQKAADRMIAMIRYE